MHEETFNIKLSFIEPLAESDIKNVVTELVNAIDCRIDKVGLVGGDSDNCALFGTVIHADSEVERSFTKIKFQ